MRSLCCRLVAWGGLLAVMLVAGLASTARAAAIELPRYQLQLGQELTYQTADLPDEQDEATRSMPNYKFNWIFTVADQDKTGWRILFRYERHVGGHVMNRAGYFHLSPEGKLTENPTVNVHVNPGTLFPAMPPDEAALANGWSSAMQVDMTRRQYRSTGPAPQPGDQQWTFEEDLQNVFSPIYELTTHVVYDFDLQQGLVTRIDTAYVQGWPARRGKQESKVRMELAGNRTLESSELAALDREMTRYFQLNEEYERISEEANDFHRTAEVLDRAGELLKEAVGEFTLPVVQAMLADQLQQHGNLRDYQVKNAERFREFLDKPSADWHTEDLAGRPRSLADYRGKVVLLDFWYRGCGWCIRAMPQLKEIAAEFPDDQVAVLGINNDDNLDDARLVIDKMGLAYETLKNGDEESAIHKNYGVQGWPTLVVLDGQGVVRHIHVGYSPNLRTQLGQKIRALLAEK